VVYLLVKCGVHMLTLNRGKHIGNSTPPSLFTFLGITPVNIVDFDGKKVLIWPSAADKGKGKEVIIGDARNVDENNKTLAGKWWRRGLPMEVRL
jgi:hypothetical protein